MLRDLPLDVAPAVRGLLAAIDRTEDIALAPGNDRLALTDFVQRQVHIIEIGWRGDGPCFRAAATIESDTFDQPHGLAFAGDDHLVVCNRQASVDVFAVPVPTLDPSVHRLTPVATITGTGGLRSAVKTPGSVVVESLGDGRHRLLVANNKWHFVSSHVLTVDADVRVGDHQVVIEEPLSLPDGLALSPDRRMLAVSNHADGEVVLFTNQVARRDVRRPIARLRGPVCPHGLAFAPSGELVVADASSPYLYVFRPGSNGWHADHDPATIVRVLDDDDFLDGRIDSREGGPKGVAIDATGSVVFTTQRFGVLRAYDLPTLLSSPSASPDLSELQAARDRQLGGERKMLDQRWSLPARARLSVKHRRRRVRRSMRAAAADRQLERLRRNNEHSSEAVVGTDGPVVSMTSHGQRVDTAFAALEAIGTGELRPSRLVLFVNDRVVVRDPPTELRRLVERGLELRLTDDVGPHTKYFPMLGDRSLRGPLVTADDDTLYDDTWLADLVRAHRARPDVVHAHRAWRIGVDDGHLLPYNDWEPCVGTAASHRHFATGVSGVLYPEPVLDGLRRAGMGFVDSTPHNDDIWLNLHSLRAGVRVAQVRASAREYPSLPDSQGHRLMDGNVLAGRNQLLLRRAYTMADVERLAAEP